METVEIQINIWVDSYTGEYHLQEKKPNRGLLIHSRGESIPVKYLDEYGLGTDGNPKSQEAKLPRKPKIPKCSVCTKQLRHVQNNQWMCQQSGSHCINSLKIIYYSAPEEEE